MKFSIYEQSLLTEHQKNDIINQINKKGLIYSNNVNEVDYLFVFGGDGTFLSALKKFKDLKIKIILFNAGRLGFLSSTQNYLDFNAHYEKFDYLEVLVNDQKFQCINEITINSNQMYSSNLLINDYEFKSLMTNQINIVNNLGSTGINRSNLKPLIFPWNHQYIIDVKNEPLYHYYKPLLQPLVLSNTDISSFNFNQSTNLTITIDNQLIKQNINLQNLRITQKQSVCSILNLDNKKYFYDKLNKLF